MTTYYLENEGTKPATPAGIPIARRAANRSIVTESAARPIRTPLPEASRPSQPVPIWLAALVATSCEAQHDGEHHTVRWNWDRGRALYTNVGRNPEHIVPLGVSLPAGKTMAVCWMPGETAYTVEVYGQAELCA